MQAKTHAGNTTCIQPSHLAEAKDDFGVDFKIENRDFYSKGYINFYKKRDYQQTQPKGCYASEEYFSEPLHPSTYTDFQSVLDVIFPRTANFSNSKTTDNSVKVVLNEPKIRNCVHILHWKEITFSLSLNVPTATNDICHFTVHILRNKVDYGELPQFISQPNIFYI